jgi:HK97 family phage major capsid protein/HK97 family phage prohead protease
VSEQIEIRAASAAPVVADSAKPRITGHFARFNSFNEIDSAVEGRFLERIAPGAFTRTLKNNGASIRMLFQHGRDPEIGDKPIGSPDVLREDAFGPYFEGDLFDSVPALIVDGLRAGQYGISYRFSVVDEDWDHSPKRSDINPLGLPERTIKQARVFEFGPVTFPADAGADYAVRSLTLADLDAAYPPRETEPALPDELAAEPHPVDGTREAEVPPPPEVAAPIPTDPPEGGSSDSRSAIVEYVTRDEKAARVTELRASLAALAVEYPGVLPTEAQTRWDNETAELDTVERDIAAWDARQARLAAYASDPAKAVPAVAPAVIVRKSEEDIYDLHAITRNAATPEIRVQKLRDNAMRAAEQMRVPGERYDQDKSRERLQGLLENNDSADKEIARLVLSTNSPQYRAAFNRYVLSSGQERAAALAVGVDGTGGFSVPVSFDPTVVAIGAWTAINPFRASCRTVTIAGTDTWQALTSTAITASYALEAAAATEQGPTFARPEFIAKRAHVAVTMSYEMLQDRSDIAGELAVLIGEAKDTLEENQFTLGTGATVYPQGIGLKDAFTRADSAGAAVAIADIRAMEAAIPIRHRLNAAWYLSRAAIRGIQGFETVNGQLFNGQGYAAVGNPANRPAGNTGLTLLGYPVYETPSMPWTPSTTDTTWGVLMDPRNYVIVDRVGLSVRVIPDAFDAGTGFPTGQSFVYAFWRNTARVLNADGGRQGGVQ